MGSADPTKRLIVHRTRGSEGKIDTRMVSDGAIALETPGRGGAPLFLKSFRQARLTQNGVGRVTARDADRHGEISLGYRTMPDFMTALSLPHQNTAGGTKQIA